jgi:hypothetical protein
MVLRVAAAALPSAQPTFRSLPALDAVPQGPAPPYWVSWAAVG